jgi:hypothetical protein
MLLELLHLFWKALLLTFGNTGKDLEQAKRLLQLGADPYSAEASHPVLTASPLDYHLFRQEITSKYPAYNPPLPLIPLELEHKSMLPPVSNQPHRSHGPSGLTSGLNAPEANSTSILHQPVHIATPAPSPPPSPAGPGGKAGKKQNYQTNQNFPFLYPPLDDTSNNIGGKGSTEMQDLMVGKKWEGSDIPASIIEAGQLFASRMRMTRAMRQLWRERELFLKHERGWNGTRFPSSSVKLDEDRPSSASGADAVAAEEEDGIGQGEEFRRLQAVEDFYVRIRCPRSIHVFANLDTASGYARPPISCHRNDEGNGKERPRCCDSKRQPPGKWAVRSTSKKQVQRQRKSSTGTSHSTSTSASCRSNSRRP